MITISLAVWSAFTAACGWATSFGQLFAARIGVGVGEAGGVAPSYAVIAESFPVDRRARALAIYSLGIPLGSAAGVMLGGQIATAVNWRTAFITVGLAGQCDTEVDAILMRILWRSERQSLLAYRHANGS